MTGPASTKVRPVPPPSLVLRMGQGACLERRPPLYYAWARERAWRAHFGAHFGPGLPRVPWGGEEETLGYHATKAHCEARGGRIVGSETLKMLGFEKAQELQPRSWPVYEAIDK